jgi:hypothetical protein
MLRSLSSISSSAQHALLCSSQRLAASCSFSSTSALSASCSASAAASAASAGLLCSDLSLRALLRNLKLLPGMREEQQAFQVLITGHGAPSVAEKLAALEPCLRLTVSGDGSSAELADIQRLKGKGKLDSIIVVQPYHALQSREAFKDIHSSLHPELGTAGFLWARAPAEVRRGWGRACLWLLSPSLSLARARARECWRSLSLLRALFASTSPPLPASLSPLRAGWQPS